MVKIEVNESRLVNEFLELVQIDSETGDEKRISEVLKSKLSALGLEVKVDDSWQKTGHGAGNLIAKLKGNAPASRLLMTAHMDTVAPGKGVKPVVQNGYIRSDGTTILGSDDKAGIAAILEGIRILQESGATHGDIQLIITAGEESGLAGAKALDPQQLEADYGFAFDSSGPVGDIITAAPTQVKLKAMILGRSAHAGVNPEDGISAIQVASKAIAQMPLGRIDRDTTANIGRFEGGGATNVVCDRVDIYAEARSLVQDKVDVQVQRMREAFVQTAAMFGATAEVDVTLMYPAYRFRDEDKVVQTAHKAVTRIGRTPRILSSGGGSDANIFSSYGVPTINLAIGYEQIHTKHECMPIRELVKAAELVVALSQEALH
jgi:tripeptide aminopeptidase